MRTKKTEETKIFLKEPGCEPGWHNFQRVSVAGREKKERVASFSCLMPWLRDEGNTSGPTRVDRVSVV